MFDLRCLSRPVVGAPMAGGPSTPALAAAVTQAGGLGFVAAGYRTADATVEQLAETRAATSGPLGVNLFVVRPTPIPSQALAAYRRELEPEAERYGVELGEPRFDDDGWDAKLELVLDLRPEVVTFTFGCPDPEVLRALRRAGVAPGVTIADADEARVAEDAGAAFLVVQGPEAGGHRGTFDPTRRPGTTPLPDLVEAVRAVCGLPVVAAGGIGRPDDVDRLWARGADAVALGTALLLADEAGTSATHRAALQDPTFDATATTPSFTGRWARGLVNRFLVEHPDAPLAYPEVHHLTSPVRRAAAAAGDPHGVHLWAGTGHQRSRPGPAVAVLDALVPTGSGPSARPGTSTAGGTASERR